MSKRYEPQSLGQKGEIIRLPGLGIAVATGTSVPTNGTSGYAVGCLFLLQGGTLGTSLYINEGTLSSCDFNAVQSAGSAAFDLAFALKPEATVTEYDLWVAPFACQITKIKYVPSTLQGGAMTATVVKATGTATPVKTTTPMVTADVIDLNAGAYTVVTPTLTATAADLILAEGDRIAVDYSAAPTAAEWALSISGRRL